MVECVRVWAWAWAWFCDLKTRAGALAQLWPVVVRHIISIQFIVMWTHENKKRRRKKIFSALQKGSNGDVDTFFFAFLPFILRCCMILSSLPENSLSWKKRWIEVFVFACTHTRTQTHTWMRSSAFCLCALGILFVFRYRCCCCCGRRLRLVLNLLLLHAYSNNIYLKIARFITDSSTQTISHRNTKATKTKLIWITMHGLMEYECQTENYRACESVSSFQQTVDSVVFGLVMLQLFRTFIVNAAGFDMEPIESLDLWHCDIQHRCSSVTTKLCRHRCLCCHRLAESQIQ